MARIGRLQVSCDFGDGSEPYVSTYRVTEVEVESVLLVGISNDESSQNSVTWYDDVNLSNTSDIDGMFRFGGTNTYTWLTAMTEVEDDSLDIELPISIANGGTGATTAAEALTNLGAASATALDALSDTVAGKANTNHTHSEYATTAAVNALEDAIGDKANAVHNHVIGDIVNLQTALDDKAAASHTHSDYATASHTHGDYATVTALNALSDEVDGKADASHTHNYASASHTHDDRYYTETEIDSMVSTINSSISGKAASSHTHAISDVTDLQSELDSIEDAIDGKADSSHSHSNYALTSHNHDSNYAALNHTHNYAAASHSHSVATTAADGYMSAADKIKLDGVVTGAEVNQNAFSNVVVGSTTIAADGQTDTLTLVAGSNVTLTPDATNDKITIAATDTVYTHPTYTARTGVPAANQTPGFGGTFTVTQPVSDGSGHITAMNSRTVTIPSTAATTSAAGLMSASDKSKLDGIASGANAYTLPTAGSSLGGVKTTSTVTSTSGYTACPIISGVPYYKDTNTTYSLSSFGVTATAAELNALDGVTATVTELNYCDGVTSNIQTQLNNKASSSHTHSYLPLSGGTMTGNIVMSNNKSIINVDESGNQRAVMLTNSSGNTHFGSGSYDASDGTVYYSGNTVQIRSKSGTYFVQAPIYSSQDLTFNDNGAAIYGTDASGNVKEVFNPQNTEGNVVIGKGGYDASSGGTNIYGKNVNVATKDSSFTVDGIELGHVDNSTCTLASGWSLYSSSDTVNVYRYGKIAYLTGAIKNNSAMTINNTKVQIFTVPSGYRPVDTVQVVCQGSGVYRWMLTIDPNGVAYAQRYGATGYVEASAGSWFPFSATWIIS